MSRSDALRAAQEARKARRAAAEEEKPRATATAPQTRPVRKTVDLAPVTNAELSEWCHDAAIKIGATRVTTQDVFTALVTRLLSDDALAAQLRDDLADVAHQRAADRATRHKPS